MSAALDRDDTYYSHAAELQRSWKLKSSPPGWAAPLCVDLSLPFSPRGQREKAVPLLPLEKLPSGAAFVAGMSMVSHSSSFLKQPTCLCASVTGLSDMTSPSKETDLSGDQYYCKERHVTIFYCWYRVGKELH